MKLSIHLFKSSITSFEGILPKKYAEGEGAYTKLPLTASLPFECEAYIAAHDNDYPKWHGFVSPYFDFNGIELATRTHSFVVFMKASGRIFGITFGLGFHAIDRAKTERRFGLKVALNSLPAGNLDTLDARNTDLVTRQSRIHVSKGSPVYEFGIEPSVDMVRFVSGRLAPGSFAKSVAGADSVTVNCETGFSGLKDFCTKLLTQFNSKQYREKFDFIDYLEPLDDQDPRVAILDGKLTEAVKARTHEKLLVAFPDIEFADSQKISTYKIFLGHDNREDEEFSLDEVYIFLNEHAGSQDELADIHVIGLNDAGQPATRKRAPWEFFAFETPHKNATYMLMCGQWLRVQRAFDKLVRKEVASLKDLTKTLKLPAIKPGEREDDYSKRVGQDNGHALLDKNNFRIGSYDKIEVCDLLTKKTDFLCVKKMHSSASLSHLFSQGSVSAQLLKGNQKYRDKIAQIARKHLDVKTTDFDDWIAEPRFVFVIPTHKAGSIADAMFFFSQVNLRQHIRTIRSTGCQVALCKVEYESNPGTQRRKLQNNYRTNMLRDLHIIRQSAYTAANAAERTVVGINDGRLQQEPAITDRMLGHIEEAMNGYTIKGVQWRTMTLTDRGRGAQENVYGADFLGVLDISIPGFAVKKGFLAQAKLIDADETIDQAEFDRMIEQCRRMLSLSPASFVFLYSRNGISVVPAVSILGLSARTNPLELYSRSSQRFFEEHFECFIGDAKLHKPNIDTLADLRRLAESVEGRGALFLKARSVTEEE